jgi:molybdopterin/thiamine biosynthesis adenylyltransferase
VRARAPMPDVRYPIPADDGQPASVSRRSDPNDPNHPDEPNKPFRIHESDPLHTVASMTSPPLSKDPSVVESIRSGARSTKLPDGTFASTLDVGTVERIARELGRPGREIEVAALSLHILPLRYSRNYRSLSFSEQIRLLESTVAVVGLGGLGGAVLETMGRIGVGAVKLIDGDRFDDSNLNRQLLATTASLGTPKAEAAEKRLRVVNPSLQVEAVEAFLTARNAEALLSGCDIVVDCLDAIPARFLLEDASKRLGIPMVSGAVAGRTGHVTTVFAEDEGLRTIYGDPETAGDKGVETELGNLPFTVSVVANLQCAEVVRLLLSRPGSLRGALLLVDLESGTCERMRLG